MPRLGPVEVLIRVGAFGLNNTDVNTRTAWYSMANIKRPTAQNWMESVTKKVPGAALQSNSRGFREQMFVGQLRQLEKTLMAH